MNTARLKEFAPAARRSLLASVKGRAMIYGITSDKPDRTLVKEEGDLVRINGILYPKDVQREWISLVEKVEKEGFEPVMEQAAYTWFNRLAALRYMEVHGYLDHKRRVLSHPEGGLRPEILEHAQDIEIPGLDRRKVLELLADGSKSEELYQYLLMQQCWALHTSLPLLFENLEPAIRLLIPDNLLAPNSIIRSFVDEIPEEDWRTTEILGWLYQYYVLEEKQRVDAYVKQGKAVEPEDIPAKTQLFTPNWIVQFLTQNSLGRLWMDVYPDSPLREKMPYFTPPAEQEPEVAAKLRVITPESLDPKTLTAIDPAAGSGHILLELYSLFFEMYREQGYPPLQIPRMILENNLHGLELDRRAAQIAGFSLLMRARADDPQLLSNPPKIRVLALRHSRDLDLDSLLSQKQEEEVFPSDRLFEGDQPRLAAPAKPLFPHRHALRKLKEIFEEADVVGSLIRVPDTLSDQLLALTAEATSVRAQVNLLEEDQLELLLDLIQQARLLSRQYSVTAMNPPYMGARSLGKDTKEFLTEHYKGAEKDVFAAFIARSLEWTSPGGYMGIMSPFTWMFIPTFIDLRQLLITSTHLATWVQLEYSGFDGATVPVCTFTLRNSKCNGEKGTYINLSEFKGAENQAPKTLEAIRNPDCGWLYRVYQGDFEKIPGAPIAFSLNPCLRAAFQENPLMQSIARSSIGLQTGDNALFTRLWFEVDIQDIAFSCSNTEESIHSRKRWFPAQKGGEFRRWSGNVEFIVDWEKNGERVRANSDSDGRIRARPQNTDTYFMPVIGWTMVTSGKFSARFYDKGHVHTNASCYLTPGDPSLFLRLTGIMNSQVFSQIVSTINPTLNLVPGQVAICPLPKGFHSMPHSTESLVRECIEISWKDWNSLETAWEFTSILNSSATAEQWFDERRSFGGSQVRRLLELESMINEEVAELYEMAYTSRSSIPLSDISLWANPLHVFRPKRKMQSGEEAAETEESLEAASELDSEVLEAKFREKGLRELISYSLGGLMGRYSLDEPGLIYANSGGEGFDPSRYESFPADEDGILPLTDQPYFGEEDTAERVAQWVKTVWASSPLEENLAFIAANLGQKAGESSMEAIRRYLVEDFYSDHLQTYKKRPIYWLFTSGRKRAFQALVYLHRYHPGTLGRMRSQYVLPLIGKLRAQVEMADQTAADPSATASQKSQRSREAKKLKDQLAELLEFETRLLHYANKAIALDLDDGVKVNYGKFSDPGIGDILAKVKEVTGGRDD